MSMCTECDRSEIDCFQNLRHRALYENRARPLGEIRANAIHIGDVRSCFERLARNAEPLFANFLRRILGKNRAPKSIDQVEAPSEHIPLQLVHDGRTEEAGVYAAFNKITLDAQGSLGGPTSHMHSPLKTRIDAEARLHSSAIRSPEGRIAAEIIAVNGKKTVLSVAARRLKIPTPNFAESALIKAFITKVTVA
jgi:hypothetical protein